jgi:hypothetical protein
MNLANRSTDVGLDGTRDSSAPTPGVPINRYGSGQRVFGSAGGPMSTSRFTRSG